MTWAQRLKRVFGIDIETCQTCGGALRIIVCIEEPLVIDKILTQLDKKDACAEPSRLPPCRAPPQAGLFALNHPDYRERLRPGWARQDSV